MSTSDGALRRLRRQLLALRLCVYEVRTEAIQSMTSLSTSQQKTLRYAWGFTEDTRHRGPTRTILERFTRSQRARSEGVVLARFCRIHGALMLEDLVGAPRQKPMTPELGERLGRAYEAFRACFPETNLEFDELINFVTSIAKKDGIEVGRCRSCGATMLIDRIAPNRPTCAHCRRRSASK